MKNESASELLARYIERREKDGVRLKVTELCGDDPELAAELAALVERYDALEAVLAVPLPTEAVPVSAEPGLAETELPAFAGFRTVERLGGGGMGEVYKLEDPKLGRTVAAKVLRGGARRRVYGDFLREARALALFQDPGIVRIHEYREDHEPPFILMEHVEGFELGQMAPALEISQRVRLMAEVCETVERAHAKGIQHRDLKPSNILLDAELRPRLVDFGLSASDPASGHGVGTPGYVAPELLDPTRPIDERADVYSLGVVFYELLCGELPDGSEPRLPMEIEPSVPEPLQAIALKAMEEEASHRYASAREMALDLRRFLGGRPVRARPTRYASALGGRLRPHLAEIGDWLHLKLIYPHEAERLLQGYRRLEAREDDWIVAGRRLTSGRIALYLGAFLLFVGALFYLAAHRVYEVVEGLAGPLLVLGLPCAGLQAVAAVLERREKRAVAVAFYLAAMALLPIFLVLVFHELGFWPETDEAFLPGVSNRELQIASVLSAVASFFLALRTRTLALGTSFAAAMLLLALAVHTDLGLQDWIDEGRWDLLALHSLPLLVVLALLASWLDRAERASLAVPLYLSASALLVLNLELLALDGRAFAYLGVTLQDFQGSEVENPALIDTLSAMTLAGLVFYGVATLLDRYGSARSRPAALLLFALSPFAVLEPIYYLNWTDAYASFFLWAYLALALAIAFLSQHRQRKSFYFAGIANSGLALYLIGGRYEWFEVPSWSIGIIVGGCAVLVLGVLFEHLEGRRRSNRAAEPRRD